MEVINRAPFNSRHLSNTTICPLPQYIPMCSTCRIVCLNLPIRNQPFHVGKYICSIVWELTYPLQKVQYRRWFSFFQSSDMFVQTGKFPKTGICSNYPKIVLYKIQKQENTDAFGKNLIQIETGQIHFMFSNFFEIVLVPLPSWQKLDGPSSIAGFRVGDELPFGVWKPKGGHPNLGAINLAAKHKCQTGTWKIHLDVRVNG